MMQLNFWSKCFNLTPRKDPKSHKFWNTHILPTSATPKKKFKAKTSSSRPLVTTLNLASRTTALLSMITSREFTERRKPLATQVFTTAAASSDSIDPILPIKVTGMTQQDTTISEIAPIMPNVKSLKHRRPKGAMFLLEKQMRHHFTKKRKRWRKKVLWRNFWRIKRLLLFHTR